MPLIFLKIIFTLLKLYILYMPQRAFSPTKIHQTIYHDTPKWLKNTPHENIRRRRAECEAPPTRNDGMGGRCFECGVFLSLFKTDRDVIAVNLYYFIIVIVIFSQFNSQGFILERLNMSFRYIARY